MIHVLGLPTLSLARAVLKLTEQCDFNFGDSGNGPGRENWFETGSKFNNGGEATS